MWTPKKAVLSSHLVQEIGRLMELYQRYSHSEKNPEIAQVYSDISEEMGILLIYADQHKKG